MNSAHDRKKEIFLHAVELASASERGAYLEAACAGDDRLRREVEDFLGHHAQLGSFLEPGGAGQPATGDYASGCERPGTLIGPYRLMEQIGEGGMGLVFVAEQQQPVRRKVAVKLIKPGLDSRAVIARFEAERQALALMDHPNIAKVFDGGETASGRPYFVMELVKGVPLTQFCDDNRLPPRERLELFISVCQAVQHAHQKGIIHRDLKPSNVLVTSHDGTPVPKVIDFGVAKAVGHRLTEKTVYTQFTQMVGTPLYMSPEQAGHSGLDIDTRTDVYALGVLLYELLTGTTPFDSERLRQADYDELRRIIREEDPARPSARISTLGQAANTVSVNRRSDPNRLRRQVRGELDWVVMKALEKDRNRRYETANAFAADVQRYLSDEPVHACPPSSVYRLRKLIRRNKVTVITTLLVAASLVIGTAVSIWQAAVARRAEAEAAARLVAETQAREQATAINQLLQEGLAAANPDSARGTDFTVRQLLDEISTRLDTQLADQRAAEAAIRATIGNAYFRLGLPEKAAPHLKRALELREQLYGPESPEVARSLYDEAFNLQEYGDVPGAFERVSRALAIHRQAGLRDIATVRILWLLQIIHQRANRDDQSEQVGREALAIARELADAGPELANVLYTLATNVVRLRGDFVESERLTRESIALHRKFRGDNHPQTARALALLGVLLAEQGNYAEAEPHLRESIAVFTKNFGYISEGEVSALPYLVTTLRGKQDQAGLESLRADVTARAKRIREERPGDAGPLFYAALALAIVDDTDGAVDILSQIAARNPGKLKVWYGRIEHLAWLLAIRPDSHQRYPGVALDLARQAIELASQDGEVWATLGVAHYRASSWQAAVQALNKSVELRSRRDVASWLFLAMAHWRLGEKDKARQWYDRAAEWMDKNQPNNEELRRFRAEAAEVLERNEKK